MSIVKKGIMEDQRLLASAALFRQLHENKKDIYDVLGQFLCSTIVIHQLWEFDVTKCSQKLNSDYGFDIPEAVVKSCLKNRLKKKDLLAYNNSKYYVTERFERNNTLKASYEQVKEEQEYIKNLLIKFVKSVSKEELNQEQLDQLLSDFYSYFIHDRKQSENSVIISQFIIQNSGDPLFTDKLNKVEEGLILYGGICYSSDLVNMEPWRNDFQIALDTELLFDAVGLNGEIHYRMFSEFFALVKGLRDRSGNKSKIELKYFEETKNEIEGYFYAAEKIFERNQHPDPSKTGMINLLQTCSTKSDVTIRKIEFFERLEKMKISLDTGTDYYDRPEYNIESISTLEKLKKEFPDYESDKIADALKIFTKINYKRKGRSNLKLEQSGALLITGKNITKSLSHYFSLQGERTIPFAVTLDYITERLWFKSHKGFANGVKLPTTFDVVARAQVILSTQVAAKVADVYKDMKEAVASGAMSKETAGNLVMELRSKNLQPEGFVPDQVEDIINFMDEDVIENALRTRSLLEIQAEQGIKSEQQVEALRKKLAEVNADKNDLVIRSNLEKVATQAEAQALVRKVIIQTRLREGVNLKKRARLKYKLIRAIYFIFLILAPVAFIVYYYTPSDTVISITSLFAGVIPLVFVAAVFKPIKKFTTRIIISSFKRSVKKRNSVHPVNKLSADNLLLPIL
ncbi:hypothetical protein EXT66_14305 [Pectobacterium carotovorum subsp. carotovorum]|nr:hypothetical protein [Pectobacterium carotovorum]MCL6335192.1 hypothetical protein [Pectobacterium carotovorum subsp. carotovorum]MCL6348211.1 hypothetical protein [Pectobacterium carotovorum subsp. carotovorum]MCL6402435.1 hypothetical protein [Pectobacterium carotovorum subsp. carotovorum]